MTITAPPTIPLITDPSTFAPRSQAWVIWQAEQLYPAMADASLQWALSNSDVSATSNTIDGVGTDKTFTVSSGKGFSSGMFLTIADATAPTVNFIYGQVVSYSGTTLIVTVKSVSGSGTKTSWVINQAPIGGAGFDSNSFSGNQTVTSGAAFRTSISTLASSTTPDIWTNQSNEISFTGVVAVTGFAPAPQAGVNVKLNCVSTPSFTAGANMLIDGYTSGQVFTAAANDTVEVLALTTTQFKLKLSRSNYISQLNSSDVITDTGANGQRTLTIDGVVRETQTTSERQSTIDGGSTLYPEFKCRSWGRFTGATGALLAGGNCSVSRTSAGLYVVTFATEMPDANYSVVVNGFETSGDVGSTGTVAAVLYTAAGFTLDCETGNGTPVQADPTNVSFAVFR